MTSNKERIMGKKKPYGKIALTVLLILTMAFVGTAWAQFEQEFNPGFEDKKGTLGVDTKSWRAGWINSIFMEGPTSNANHTVLSATDPTAVNRILLPDSSGTIALTGDISTTMALSNGTMLIGNIGGLAVEATMTGDVTVTNALVATIGDNKIGTAEFNVNTITIDFWPSQTSNTATVTAGSTILGVYAFANVDAEVANIAAISSTTLTLTLVSAAANDISLFKVVVLEP